MLTPSMRNWFGRSARSTVAMLLPATVSLPPDTAAEPSGPRQRSAVASRAWCEERLALCDALWGEGYHLSGGEPELLRMLRPLGLSGSSNVLLLEGGGGGILCSLLGRFGATVHAFEADATLRASAAHRVDQAHLGRRSVIRDWDPAEPRFPEAQFHHALAIEPLRGHQPETLLAALAAALKPGGQLLVLDLVADTPLRADEPGLARWVCMEGLDPASLPAEITVTRALGRLGYDVRIVEDLTQRHTHQAIMGWRRMVRGMQEVKPSHRQAAALIQEAELWLLRLRLMREGRLRLVRWHAIRGMA